jgi:hypothetical protein
MIPLGMEMVDIVAQRLPQRPLAEEDHLAQAFLLDRPYPALGVGIQVSGFVPAARAVQSDLRQGWHGTIV